MKNKGFTLIELIITVTIISILAVSGLGSYRSAQKRARDAKRVQDMRTIQTSAEQYYVMSEGDYPADTNDSSWTINGNRTLDTFPIDSLGIGYSYTTFTDGYCACALVEDTKVSNASDSTNCNIGTPGTYYCVRNRQ